MFEQEDEIPVTGPLGFMDDSRALYNPNADFFLFCPDAKVDILEIQLVSGVKAAYTAENLNGHEHEHPCNPIRTDDVSFVGERNFALVFAEIALEDFLRPGNRTKCILNDAALIDHHWCNYIKLPGLKDGDQF